jgi:hypothetical protein
VGKLYKFVFILLLLALFLAEFFHPITAVNDDLARHILLGEIIVQTHHVPTTNLLSYTYTNYPYIAISWLTEVIFYFLFVNGGFTLLLIVNTILVALAFGSLIFYATKKYHLTHATLLSITLYLLLLGLRSDIRPEVMSMFCLSLFMTILYVSQRSNKNILLFLIPVELLWVNLHIYFFVGPLLILLFLLDNLITNHFKFVKAKWYFFTLIGTAIITAINPNGIQGALFPFTVLNNYGFPIVENQSLITLFTIYHSSEIVLPACGIIILFIVLFWAKKNTLPIDWFLAIFFGLAVFFMFRNILLFVFTTFLTFTAQLNFLFNKYRSDVKKFPFLSYVFYYPLSLCLLILLIVGLISQRAFGTGAIVYGKNAIDFLQQHSIQEPYYNNFDIGGYLAYRIYPKRVFLDNRPEAYPASFFQKTYIPMQDNPDFLKKLDQRYRFNAIIIQYWDNTPWGYPLLTYLVNSSNFKLIYLDQYIVLLVRNTQENRKLVTQYLITKNSFKMNSTNNTEDLIHYLFFFEKVGWRNNLNTTIALIKKLDPQMCSLKRYPLEKSSIQQYIRKHNLTKNCHI